MVLPNRVIYILNYMILELRFYYEMINICIYIHLSVEKVYEKRN